MFPLVAQREFVVILCVEVEAIYLNLLLISQIQVLFWTLEPLPELEVEAIYLISFTELLVRIINSKQSELSPLFLNICIEILLQKEDVSSTEVDYWTCNYASLM